MTVLVTGGDGFIGAAVVRRLHALNHHVEVFDRESGADICDTHSVYDAVGHADAVIHLAGVLGTHELFDTPFKAYDVNVRGTLNVLEGCRAHSAGYVGITMPQVFPSIYTATKVAQTRLASAYNFNHGVPVSHVRAFNAFGPGQHHGVGHPQKIIPAFADAGWRGEPMPIWGDGEQTVDLVHVDDVARMLVDALEWGDDCTFDGGTGEAFTVNQVADMVAWTTHSSDRRYLPMRRGEIPTNIVATGEGWDRLDWRPEFDAGLLADTVRWYA